MTSATIPGNPAAGLNRPKYPGCIVCTMPPLSRSITRRAPDSRSSGALKSKPEIAARIAEGSQIGATASCGSSSTMLFRRAPNEASVSTRSFWGGQSAPDWFDSRRSRLFNDCSLTPVPRTSQSGMPFTTANLTKHLRLRTRFHLSRGRQAKTQCGGLGDIPTLPFLWSY